MLNLRVLFCTFVCLGSSDVFANVVLKGSNVTLSFEDIEANFTPPVNESGECGTLFLAQPLDACSKLTNNSIEDSIYSPYVLITRGGCSFEDKVRRAQAAGFKAAIVYNNDGSDLVAMAGDSAGIKIHAVFVSRASGLTLRKYVGRGSIQVWLVQSYESWAWSIMAVSFLSLLAMSAVLATCFFVRRHRVRRQRPRAHGMSSRSVNAMPSLVFTAVLEDNCTSSATCAICLEDYSVGDKLRILPCSHKFHTLCVDAWLTSWRTFCPVCKRDARTRTRTGEPPSSERTPLLSSMAIQIAPSSSPTFSNISTISTNHPSYPTTSQSSFRSHLVSSSSLGYPLSPHTATRYVMSPHPLRHTDSVSSFSPFASAHSLPEC